MFSVLDRAVGRHVDGVLPEIGQFQVLAQQSAVGVRIGAHAAAAPRRERLQLGPEPAVGIEELLGLVAAQPALEQLQVGRILTHLRERHLVRPPRALHLVALDRLRPGPPFGRAEDDHRPARPERRVRLARALLIRANLPDRLLERRGHLLVHLRGIAPLDEVRRVAVSDEQRLQLLVADAREDRRVGDLVAVQVQDRQHRAVADRVEELVRVPCGGQRSGLRLAVADHAGDDQIGVVERHAVRVGEAVPEFPAFVNRAGRLGRDVAADVAGERELLEELPHAFNVLALVRVDLRVRAFEVGRPEHAGRPVSRSGHEHHVEVVPVDHAVQVHPGERERGARTPMAEQPLLDVLRTQRFAQQRIVLEIDHPDRQVVARAPVRVEQVKFLCGQLCVRGFVQHLCSHGILLLWRRCAETAADGASIAYEYCRFAAAASQRAWCVASCSRHLRFSDAFNVRGAFQPFTAGMPR